MAAGCFCAVGQTPPGRGLTVEQVENGSSAEKAGFQPGDTILAWSRAGERFAIETPIDLTELDIEQAVRGPVTLEGLRGVEARTWSISRETSGPSSSPYTWGLVCRPWLAPDVLAIYERSANFAHSGAWAEAADGLRPAASLMQKSDPARPWLLQRTAEWRAQAKQAKEAYDAYEDAVRLAADAQPRVRAFSLMACGDSARVRNDWAQAERCYSRSLSEARISAPASLTIAAILNSLGNIANFRGDAPKAEDYYRQALGLRQELAPGSLDVGRSFNNLGLLLSQHDPEQGEKYLRESLAILEKLVPETLDIATILSNLGKSASRAGHLDRAEAYFRQELSLQEKLATGSLGHARALLDCSGLLLNRGDLAGAEEFGRRAVTIAAKTPGSVQLADSLFAVANVTFRRGDFAQAEEYYNQSLVIRQKLAPGSLSVAGILHNLGAVELARGDLSQAEGLLLRASSIEQKYPITAQTALTLNELGRVARDRGDLGKAEDYQRQALAISEKLAPGGLGVANVLNHLGTTANKAGDLPKAEGFYRDALAILQKRAPSSLETANTLGALAELEFGRGHFSKAEDYYRQAAELQKKVAPGTNFEALSLFNLAMVLSREGETERALPFYQRATESLDQQMSRLGGTDEVRSQFRTQFDAGYRAYVGALLTQKQPQQAFAAMEQSRARSLLAMVAERDLVFAADLPPEVQRQRRINAADYDRTQSEIARLDREKDASRVEPLAARMRDLASEREKIIERVKQASPRLAALQYPQPLDYERARQTLDVGTVLLSYAASEDRTLLFVVQSRGVDPGLTVYTLPVGVQGLRSRVAEYRKMILEYSSNSREAVNQAGRALYDLLVRPAEAQIGTANRLLVIPDGPLHTLPFAALLRSEQQYLIEWKPLHTIVSATLYDEVKKKRMEPHHPALQLAAFGDPIYPKQTADALLRAATERGLDLSRLPFSREEVTAIAAAYGERSRVFLGAEATEEHAKSVIPSAGYIHFATHAFVDERFPLNSGLALTIPEKPLQGQENGLLQAWEIFEQVRLDADLVVLSACQTGLGTELGGEGLLGLTRALQYAGARSIIASLWNVDDLKTSQLMKSLYSQLQKGKSKDEALRAAQLELLRSHSASHPFFWAAFSLIGDWR